VPSSTPISNLTNPKDESFRDHVSDEAEDSLLERWTKLGEAVLAHGVPTEGHIAEMTALACSEQDQIKRKLRRTAFAHSIFRKISPLKAKISFPALTPC